MKLNIWLILDGKRGHEKQIEDLAFCISKKIKTNIIKIKKNNILRIFFNFFRILNDPCKSLPPPDFIFAAGHQTHLDAIQKKNRYGGKVIIIMKSSFPNFLFDLSIVTLHDKTYTRQNIFHTEGSVNRIINEKKQIKNEAIILVGGPSKNFFWDTKEIELEIKKIIEKNHDIKFTIGTSRRTPPEFMANIPKDIQSRIKIVKHNKCPINWIEKQISKSEYAWVTQDSISMLYELVSAGSKVTCISLEPKNDKFINVFDKLYQNKKINFTNRKVQKLEPLENLKSTADICANYIYKTFITD